MVLEVAIFDVTDPDGFAAAYQSVREVISGAHGCRSVRMTRGIETPTCFILMVEWDSVQAHEDFRAAESFATWRGAIGPFFASPPQVEHFTDLD